MDREQSRYKEPPPYGLCPFYDLPSPGSGRVVGQGVQSREGPERPGRPQDVWRRTSTRGQGRGMRRPREGLRRTGPTSPSTHRVQPDRPGVVLPAVTVNSDPRPSTSLRRVGNDGRGPTSDGSGPFFSHVTHPSGLPTEDDTSFFPVVRAREPATSLITLPRRFGVDGPLPRLGSDPQDSTRQGSSHTPLPQTGSTMDSGVFEGSWLTKGWSRGSSGNHYHTLFS